MSVEQIIDFSNSLDDELSKVLELAGAEVVKRTQRRTPVRTGRLRDGWDFKVNDAVLEISNDVPYAVYVEYGTPFMAPRGALTTTLMELDDILKEVTE